MSSGSSAGAPGALRPAFGATLWWRRNRSASAAGPDSRWPCSGAVDRPRRSAPFSGSGTCSTNAAWRRSTELVELERAIALDRSDLAWTAPTEAGEVPTKVISAWAKWHARAKMGRRSSWSRGSPVRISALGRRPSRVYFCTVSGLVDSFQNTPAPDAELSSRAGARSPQDPRDQPRRADTGHPRLVRSRTKTRSTPGERPNARSPASADQTLTTGQVMVRVMPSIRPMSCTTMRPRSFTDGASVRAMTS